MNILYYLYNYIMHHLIFYAGPMNLITLLVDYFFYSLCKYLNKYRSINIFYPINIFKIWNEEYFINIVLNNCLKYFNDNKKNLIKIYLHSYKI